MHLGEKLKKLRSTKDLTQEKAAEMLGIKRTAYASYETGRVDVSTDLLQRIALLYNVTIDFLMDNGSLDEEKRTESVEVQTKSLTFLEKRRNEKLQSGPFMVPFFPVKAQAGYTRASDQAIFVDSLERFAMPPGIDPYGAEWRYYEVAGDSMENTFFPGDILLTSLIPPMDWDNLRNFYVYVVITQDRVTVKRVARHPDDPNDFVLISDNYENYKQTRIPIVEVKELWVYRRTFKLDAKPPIVFKIDV